MPITPIHFGPGLLFKSIALRQISWTAFALAQVAVDVEPLVYLLHQEPPFHRGLHTLAGAAQAGTAASLVLHLRPELIHLERVVDELDFVTTSSYYMDWIEGGALSANPPWDDDTRTGAYGAGSLGTAEKGEYWLKAAIEEKAGHVAEIHEQYCRRRERRGSR